MSLSPAAIDRIVANVLTQISPAAAPVAQAPAAKAVEPAEGQASSVTISQSVVTADVLEDVNETSTVYVSAKAIITPAAWDIIRSRQIAISRGEPKAGSAQKTESKPATASPSAGLVIVVRNTSAVEQLWQELQGSWQRELLGCPDDAAKLAISHHCRGPGGRVLILAEQSFRAACLANRNEQVKAVAVNDVAEVKTVKKQVRANVWCVNPNEKSYFELKNLLKSIQAKT